MDVQNQTETLKQITAADQPTGQNPLCNFLEQCPAPVIGITGTRGKSTTAEFLAAMLNKQFPQVVWIDSKHSLINILPQITKDTILILELSAWQLAQSKECKRSPYVSIISNISLQNFPKQYTSFQDYLADEKLIFKYQKEKDYVFLNFSDPIQREIAKEGTSRIYFYSTNGDELLAEELPKLNQKARLGAYIKNKKIYYGAAQNEICDLDDIKLLGRQNLPSALAAVSVADLYNVPIEKIKEALKELVNRRPKLKKLN